MSHHKKQQIFQNLSSNFSSRFSQNAVRRDRVGNLGNTKAHYRDIARHFGQTDMGFGGSEMLGFHRDITFGHTNFHNSVAPRCSSAMVRDQIGGTENSYSVAPRCIRRKPKPKFFARIYFYGKFLVDSAVHSWQDSRHSNRA